ncbi:type I secretion system permease/ATPase [Roseibium sp. MMSF_3544]|uniref:type I secretion system permease/ATPase n=1 Tax=unclassified Roseibium TaxID=2629323 RepID=UPI00273E5A0D|nr:type I secretion system permease/ATPase [Roseibium sp. MMSF_3544]
MFRKVSPVRKAWSSLGAGFWAIAAFSMALNVLALAAPLYMLQVYDRVLTSQNMDTLIALTVLLGGVFLVTGLLDWIRQRMLNRLGARFELKVGVPVLSAAMRRNVQGNQSANDNSIEDVNGFRDFISGSTLLAFFDAPWIPVYIGVLYILHPYLGHLGLAGALILTVLALINNARSHDTMAEAAEARRRSDTLYRTGEANAEIVHALGMHSDLAHRWHQLQVEAHRLKTRVNDRISTFSVVSKTFRTGLQSAILGLGAALAITGESTAGIMIAATIVLGRALAPIDQLIGQWRSFLAATGSYAKLRKLVHDFPVEEKRLHLPSPRVSVSVAIQKAGPPMAQSATLSDIRMNLQAGDAVAVIGASGSGKTTLAKMLAGIWMPQRGTVRLDGNPTAKWDKEELGRHIGYLPQEVVLFDGTIRENIARFAAEIDDDQVLEAALAADVHDLITNLPEGYETRLGGGFFLSGGQRQRIALARALYGNPFLMVLDEPNSDLDSTGEAALHKAVRSAQERGGIVVMMTHRPSTLQVVGKVLVLNHGMQTAFGDRDDVLRDTRRNVLPASRQAATDTEQTTQERAVQ